jgi:prevent-host-death family protein
LLCRYAYYASLGACHFGGKEKDLGTFTIQEAKKNLSQLIKRACEGEEVIIARGSNPVARLIPVAEIKKKRRPGSMKGRISIGPEFFEPLSDDELAGWE